MRQGVFFFTVAIIAGFACKKISDASQRTSQLICNSNSTAVLPQISTNLNAMTDTNYSSSVCGIIPLHKSNYWIYRDSFFNANGSLQRVSLDTLSISKTKKSSLDTTIWWEFKSSRYKGVEKYIYNTDSTTYFGNYSWGSYYTEKWLSIPNTDSAFVGFLYTDVIASDKVKKINSPLTLPSGTFNSYFVSLKRYLAIGTLETYFVPNIGVVKFNSYQGIPGAQFIYQKSELLSYSIN